ncbi:hypothetical protein J6590_000623 [Homalodisca vitripennis]|nr:hypothetical protein J6590_000623 [Homalodisca vitripennis]
MSETRLAAVESVMAAEGGQAVSHPPTHPPPGPGLHSETTAVNRYGKSVKDDVTADGEAVSYATLPIHPPPPPMAEQYTVPTGGRLRVETCNGLVPVLCWAVDTPVSIIVFSNSRLFSCSLLINSRFFQWCFSAFTIGNIS